MTLTNEDVIAISLDRIDNSLAHFCNNADTLCNYIDGWNTQNERLHEIDVSVDSVSMQVGILKDSVDNLTESVGELTGVLTEIRNYIAGSRT